MSLHIDKLKTARYITLTVLLLFAVRVFAAMFAMPLDFFESINLTEPLNMYINGNYMTWYYHEFIKFNPSVSTGPTVLFPIYFLFAVFNSSSYILARGVVYIYFLLLLWLFYRDIYLRDPDHKSSFFGTVFFLSAFAVEAPFPLFNVYVLGEVPAMAMLSISFYLMRDERPSREYLAGLFLGLAILTKLVIALAIAPVLVVMLLDYWFKRDAGKLVKRAWMFALGVVSPIVTWRLYILFVLGYQGYLENRIAAKAFITSNTYSPLESPISMALLFFKERVEKLLEYLHIGPVMGVVFVVFILVVIGMVAYAIAKKKVYDRFYLLVFIYGLTHVCWWILFDRGYWPGHLYPGLMTLVMGLVLVLYDMSRKFPSYSNVCGAVAAVFLLLFISTNHDFYTHLKPGEFSFKPTKLAAYEKKFADKIIRMADEGYVFFGYGWWQSPEISYLSKYPFYNIYNVVQSYNLLQEHRGMVVIDTFWLKQAGKERKKLSKFIDIDVNTLQPEAIEKNRFIMVPITKFDVFPLFGIWNENFRNKNIQLKD